MDENQKKEGLSVKELEKFAKKYRFEVFFAIAFVLACFCSFIWGTGLSVIFASLGALLGVIFPARVELFSKKVMDFVFKQAETTQLILGIVLLILAIFLPLVIFLKLGLHGGKDIFHRSLETYSRFKKS